MIIISGPSTIGKNPLIENICQETNFDFITPVTTRNARSEETNGIDYFFINQADFKKEIIRNSFLEWDYCLSNYYGFRQIDKPENKITHSLSRMAIRIKRKIENTKTVFLYPNNINQVEKTLKTIYSGSQLELRVYHMREELEHSGLFDYVFKVENGRDILKKRSFNQLIRSHLR